MEQAEMAIFIKETVDMLVLPKKISNQDREPNLNLKLTTSTEAHMSIPNLFNTPLTVLGEILTSNPRLGA